MPKLTKADVLEIERRFNHHKPSPEAVKVIEANRARLLQATLDTLNEIPSGQEAQEFLRHMEQALFVANAAVARRWEGSTAQRESITR